MHITAVVTAYHPDERLRGVVDTALASCDRVIVVDNTPGAGAGSGPLAGHDDERVAVLASGRNLGLAAALNLGLAELPADCDAVLLLDQDSVLPESLVEGLAADLGSAGGVGEPGGIGVVGPSPVDAGTGRVYETFAGRHGRLDDRDTVITSGMLLRRECLEAVPAFREDFFVDYVDVDFCLRLRRAGVRIVRDLEITMPHSIGDVREHRFLGRRVQVGHYAAWRHYWIARNGTTLVRENLRGLPAWAALNTLFLGRWFVQLVLFESERRSHAPAFLRGVRDGFSGRVESSFVPEGAEYRGRG